MGEIIIELLVGKSHLINAIKSCIENANNVKEILFHGISDKEIIDSIEELSSDIEKQVEIKIIIPKLRDFQSITWLKKYSGSSNIYEIRTNHRCCSQFILMDETFIFISGNAKTTSGSFAEGGICLIEEENDTGFNQLKDIFMTNWNSGFHLRL